MKPLDARQAGSHDGGASFSLGDRLRRVVWMVIWGALASWTPPPLNAWRCVLLRLFGAKIAKGARVYGSVRIWYPGNLDMGELACLGRGVTCYNQGHISIGARATISQGAHLCASSHDIKDWYNQLVLRPIRIEPLAWVAADAFVGPGVTVGEGAVLGARGVAMRDLEAWGIYRGNPAERIGTRAFGNRPEGV